MNVLCGAGQRSVELGDQWYGYKMLMYLLCTVPTELWARLARLDISCPLALWSQKKSVLFALERRAFRVNKPEKWQTLYNEELPEKTHSAPELTWRTNSAWKWLDKKTWAVAENMRNKNMTESVDGTGLNRSVRLFIQILDLLNTDNVKIHTNIQTLRSILQY